VAGEGVEVAGEGGDEGLAFACFHLGDFALVKGHATDHLDVEVAHADDAAAGFADYGEGFGEDVVEDLFFGGDTLVGVGDVFEGGGDAGAEFDGLGGEFGVGELLGGFVEAVDLGEDGEHALDGTFIGGAEDFGEGGVEHGGFLWGWRVRRGYWMAEDGPQEAGPRTLRERRLAEAGGCGMERGGVLSGWTHGPRSGVERTGGRREHEGFGFWGCDMDCEGLGEGGSCCTLAEQGADVATAEGKFSGTQTAGIRCAQGREQEEEAGEMAIPQTHTLSMLNEMRVERYAGT